MDFAHPIETDMPDGKCRQPLAGGKTRQIIRAKRIVFSRGHADASKQIVVSRNEIGLK
jgi:hypothetical protein